MPDESPPAPVRRSDDVRSPSCQDASGSGRPSRRSFLASSAAAIGVAGTAGCVELLPPLGQGQGFPAGSVSPPDRGAPRYHQYVPAPQDSPVEYELNVVALPNVDVDGLARFDWVPGRTWFVWMLDFFGVGYENYDLVASVSTESTEDGEDPTVIVLEGPVVPGEVGPLLRDSGYRADGTRGRFDRYVRSDVPRTVAVTDGLLVFGSGVGRDETIAAVRETVEVGPTMADTDAGRRRFLENVGQPARMHVFDSTNFTDEYAIERIVKAWDSDGESFYHSDYFLYEDEAPSREEIRDDIVVTGDEDAIEIDISDRLVSIRRRLPLASISPGSVGLERSGRAPQVTWGVDDEGETIEIRHEAGEATPAEYLAIRDGWMDDPALPTQFGDEYTTVGPGATVRVDSDEIVDGPLTVRWEDGEIDVALLEYRP